MEIVSSELLFEFYCSDKLYYFNDTYVGIKETTVGEALLNAYKMKRKTMKYYCFTTELEAEICYVFYIRHDFE